MQWVYAAGSSTKRRVLPDVTKEARKTIASGFFSGFSSFFGGGAPQRQPSPIPEGRPAAQSAAADENEEIRKLMQVNATSVVLAVFSADVDVVLDERMKRELLRATKKNAPHKMKYELIYVSKIRKVESQQKLKSHVDWQRRIRCEFKGRPAISSGYWKCLPRFESRYRRVVYIIYLHVESDTTLFRRAGTGRVFIVSYIAMIFNRSSYLTHVSGSKLTVSQLMIDTNTNDWRMTERSWPRNSVLGGIRAYRPSLTS